MFPSSLPGTVAAPKRTPCGVSAARALGKLEGKARLAAAIGATKQQRHAAHAAVVVFHRVERTDIVLAHHAHGAHMRHDRLGLVLHLAEHQPAGAASIAQRQQPLSLVAADEWLDRGRVDHVEADHLGTGLERRLHHLGELRRPHRPRHVLERLAAIGLLVDGDDDGRAAAVRRRREDLAQPEQKVERQAVEPGVARYGEAEAGDQGDDAGHQRVAQAPVHARLGACPGNTDLLDGGIRF
jgi:hypothetical protein